MPGPVTTWIADCLRKDKPSWYITNHRVNSAFHPSRVGYRVPAYLAGVTVGHVHLCRVASNTVYGSS